MFGISKDKGAVLRSVRYGLTLTIRNSGICRLLGSELWMRTRAVYPAAATCRKADRFVESVRERKMKAMEIWYDKSATDQEIKECRGDYIGCEICVNAGRCFSLLLEKLNKVSEGMRKEDEGK